MSSGNGGAAQRGRCRRQGRPPACPSPVVALAGIGARELEAQVDPGQGVPELLVRDEGAGLDAGDALARGPVTEHGLVLQVGRILLQHHLPPGR